MVLKCKVLYTKSETEYYVHQKTIQIHAMKFQLFCKNINTKSWQINIL